MSKHQNDGAGHTENTKAGDAEENVAHVHHARVPEHPIESPLRDRNQSDIDDVAE